MASPKLQPADLLMPAEWERHAATWLAWPHAEDDFPGKLSAVRWAYTEIIRQLTRGERVQLIVVPSGARAVLRQLRQAGIDVEQVTCVERATDRSWARDYLPLFVVPRSKAAQAKTPGSKAPGSTPQLAAPQPVGVRGARSGLLGAVKFRFNGWARYANHRADEAAGRAIARETAAAAWQPSYARGARRARVVLEGGAIDVDGEGTLLTTERCLLGSPHQRNPGLDREGTEQVLSEYLGIRQVIWLADGIAGDDTSGHVDDFARFVAPGRVVVAREPNRRDDNHSVLRDAAQRLGRARDAAGRRLEVIELPMPAAVRYRGERLPASYANFYIANEVVLVPTFNDPADRVALNILADLFPDRRVVGIHATELVVGLGTLHCSTMQQPDI